MCSAETVKSFLTNTLKVFAEYCSEGVQNKSVGKTRYSIGLHWLHSAKEGVTVFVKLV